MKNIEVRTTISRNSRDEVHIRIRDDSSRVEFVDVCLSLEDYALLISGLGEIKATAEINGLDVVGKVKIKESRVVESPENVKDLSQWLMDNCQEEWWLVDAYLGSQGSKSYLDGKTFLNYSVYKYVDKE